jgi:transposase
MPTNTDGTAVESLDLSEERDRLEREQRKLSRKEHESNNWENQRQRVAECHLDIKRKRRDFLRDRNQSPCQSIGEDLCQLSLISFQRNR